MKKMNLSITTSYLTKCLLVTVIFIFVYQTGYANELDSLKRQMYELRHELDFYLSYNSTVVKVFGVIISLFILVIGVAGLVFVSKNWEFDQKAKAKLEKYDKEANILKARYDRETGDLEKKYSEKVKRLEEKYDKKTDDLEKRFERLHQEIRDSLNKKNIFEEDLNPVQKQVVLADKYKEEGEVTTAIKEMEKAISLDRFSTKPILSRNQLHKKLAYLYLKLEETTTVIDLLQEYLEANPNSKSRVKKEIKAFIEENPSYEEKQRLKEFANSL